MSSNTYFQEKHTTGHLWWKKTYYTYWRLSEDQLFQLPKYDYETIKSFENK